jgi:hypothetical protein
MEEETINKIKLELGDIIEIRSPTNLNLNENNYYIEYIDAELIKLVNIATLSKTNLSLTNWMINDESITQIILLNRSELKGYVRQNDLEVHKWIEIHFDDGDTPELIFGEITNIEDDMIELTRYPDFMKLYIDFEYKGIPKHLPIIDIKIRDKPSVLTTEPEDITCDVPITKSTITYDEKGEATYNEGDEVPDENIFDTLNDLYKSTNEVIFGEDLDDVVLNVEIPEYQRTYGIEIQANSLLDQLLSTIPTEKQTRAVKQKINTLINRYKQLRENFSTFNEHNDIVGYTYRGPDYKPLVEKMKNLSEFVKWIIPIVKQRKCIHPDQITEEDAAITMDDNNDYMPKSLTTELCEQYNSIITEYKSSATLNRYSTFYNKIHNLFAPFYPEIGNKDLLLENHTISQHVDTIVSNFQNFDSTNFNENKIQASKYVVQRYNLGSYKKSSYTSAAGNTVFYRTPMTPNDKMSIQSLIFLPEVAVSCSKPYLNSTNMLSRINNNLFLSYYKIFENTEILNSTIIDNLDEEYAYGDDGFLVDIKHFLLDNGLNEDGEKFEKLLSVLIPPTRALFRHVRKYLKYKLNMHDIVKELEPFCVYNDDICYDQYKEFRFYIIQQIKEFKKQYKENEKQFQDFRLNKLSQEQKMNVIERMVFNEKTLYDYIIDGYKLKGHLSNTELLTYIMKNDGFRLLYDILTFNSMKTLMSAEDILAEFVPAQIDDHGANEKIKPKDCVRRFLSKKYDNLHEMAKENGEEDIYFDSEYDDTPYGILSEYKKEKDSMDARLFRDFLKENIKNKHFYDSNQVQDEYIEELLDDLIQGKKKVREGHYAILQLVPKLPEHIDPESLSASDKKQLEIERETRKKVGYYIRKKNQWVYDSSIDPEMFLDNNSLFCNISKECVKNDVNNVCESKKTAKMRLEELNKSRMVKEFANRVHMTIEQLNDYIKEKTAYDFKQLHSKIRLNEMAQNRHNNYIYEIGRTMKELDIIRSPYADLRDKIVDQDDFVKKQGDILKFIDYYCREALQDVERVEDQYWFYCKETNTKLLPIVCGILAKAFFENNYGEKLKELCNNGKLSDDGNAIVDQHSGYELRKIDFVSEEGYTEEGFKIVTHDILKSDLATRLTNIFGEPNAPIFENEQTERIYNVTKTICQNISIPIDSVSDYVIAQTIEQMNLYLEKEEKYQELAKKKQAKNPKAKPLPYKIYSNRIMFWFIVCNLIVIIQTTKKPFVVKKTFPGCVKSFNGYPLKGVEDNSTITYFACVLNKLGKDIEPWDSIKKVKGEDHIKMIGETMRKYILSSSTVENMYKEKHEYLAENPESSIPDEVSDQRWKTFLPPLVKNVMPALRSVSRDFEKEFITLMREGKPSQSDFYNIVKSKIMAHGYGVLSMIRTIIEEKDPLLKTVSNIPFIDNACCNEERSAPMDYFISEEPNIRNYFQVIDHLSELVQEVHDHSKAPIIFDKRDTKLHYPEVEGLTEQIIYETFIHYCNLTNELPIPDDFTYIMSEKPADFPQTTIEEQMEFLKRNGKKFSKVDFHILMRKLGNKSQITLYESFYKDKEIVFDILKSLNDKDSQIVDANLREHLHNLYEKYDPNVMVVEERKELTDLKEYLYTVNKVMFNQIVRFIDRYGNVNDIEYGEFQDYLLKLSDIKHMDKDSLFNMIQFVKNSCYYLSKMYPSIVRNNDVYNVIHNHWEFSNYHNMDLQNIIDKDYNILRSFQGDLIMNNVLKDVETKLNDLTLLMSFLPIHYNIEKNGYTYVSLFDNDAIQLLYHYYWYSCFLEYINSANNKDHLLLDIETQKQQRRRMRQEFYDESLHTEGQGEDPDIEEIDITMGNLESLKKRVGLLLVSFYKLDQSNYFILSSYDVISKKVAKLRYDEKQSIVKALGDITDQTELDIEDEFKKYKMGKWNLGLTKALVSYDRNLYDSERDQLEINEHQIDVDGADEQVYDEGHDISHLGEDYQDGDYYGDYVDE